MGIYVVIIAMHFVSASIYTKAIRLAIDEGLSSDRFDHHKTFKEIQECAKYIPISLLFDVYEIADRYLESGFGVRQGKQLNSEDYGTLGLSWRTCWKAKEVFDRIERFMVLVTDHGFARIEEKKDRTMIQLLRDPDRRGVAISNETSLVMFTGILEEVTGQKILPLEVKFKHESNCLKPFLDYFQCPVSFNSYTNSLDFSTTDIDIPTLKADQHIQQYLVDRLDEEKRGIHVNTDKLLGEIHGLIQESLPSGIPSVIQVAEHLGMSARTLKRRLSEKGMTFRDYVQEIQQEVAQKLIQNTSQSMGEIAFQTGFSEQSSFNRAFKRRTGLSPVDYRKNENS
ncbi:MAG: helix-turn-helix domain-containing protein [Cyclobacteriaceae bacterium]